MSLSPARSVSFHFTHKLLFRPNGPVNESFLANKYAERRSIENLASTGVPVWGERGELFPLGAPVSR